ncbi:MAG: hypothetical protein RMK99_16260 [Anaerolineales bacterium]|nr:hypothetical protein [Anaerolineales bacterium]
MPETAFNRNREIAPEQPVKALTDVKQATMPPVCTQNLSAAP